MSDAWRDAAVALAVAVVLVGVLCALALWAVSGFPVTVEGRPSPQVTIPLVQEDDPGWDCRTMGNRVCGPTVAARWRAAVA